MPEAKFVPVQYQDADGNWRVKISQMREGIHDARRQQVFLEALAEHGRMMDACRAAGVGPASVRHLRDRDSDFDEACMQATETYRDRVISHHQNLLFEGQEKVTYDRNGNVVSSERVYPLRLIEMELKKHDEGYREKREVDLKVSGGVLIAPADVTSIDDWETRFGGDSAKTIEGELASPEEEPASE